jgi:hypothetical protein
MTVTIPTTDLVGILADTVPFASPDTEVPVLNAIRVEWDGAALHAMSTDRYRIAWSTWNPDDEPDDDRQDDLFADWGADDIFEKWHVHIALDDAKDIIGAYKLPAKEAGGVAVSVRRVVDAAGEQLVVDRSRLTGHSAITMVVRCMAVDPDPDIRGLLARHDVAEPVRQITYNARFLADFAKVRQQGPLRMTHTPSGMTLVAIGERFVGAIQAVKEAGTDG